MAVPEIDRKTVQRVVKMRKDGKSWAEVRAALKIKEPGFELRVRPLMKEIDPSSVLPLGPGSPKYGKAKPKAGKSKATAKRKTR